MKKNLRLLIAAAMCALGVGQGYAQIPDPLVDFKFGENGTVTNGGTYAGSIVKGRTDCADADGNLYTGVIKTPSMNAHVQQPWGSNTAYNSFRTIYDPVKDAWYGIKPYDPLAYWYLKYNSGDITTDKDGVDSKDELGEAFNKSYTVEVLYKADRPDSKSYYPNYNGKVYGFYNAWPNSNDNIIISSWNTYGWYIYHNNSASSGEMNGFVFRVNGTNKEAYTYTNDKNEEVSVNKATENKKAEIVSHVLQVPGKFYHVVATADCETNKIIALYVNGEKVGEEALDDNFRFYRPNLGLGPNSYGFGAWLDLGQLTNLGGNYYSADKKTNVKNAYSVFSADPNPHGGRSMGGMFVKARIYGEAFTESQVKELYNDDVKYYTETLNEGDLDKDMLLDVRFATDGSASDASSFKGEIVKKGDGAKGGVVYNADQKRNVATFAPETFEDEVFKTNTGTTDNPVYVYTSPAKYTKDYYYRDVAMELGLLSRLNDEFSIEAYTKLASATPTHSMVPIGMLHYDNGGDQYKSLANIFSTSSANSVSPRNESGIGYMVSTKGNIAFELNTAGWHDNGDGTGAITEHGFYKTLSANNYVGELCTEAGSATADWTHVVMTFKRNPNIDNGEYSAVLFVNGEHCSDAIELSPTEYIRMQNAPFQYFGIGADADRTYFKVDAENPENTYLKKFGEFAFDGDMSICRIWSKSLTDDDVTALYAEAQNPGATVTMNAAGYATLCVPYNFTVPTGFEAYVVVKDGTNNVLKKLADAGEVVAYGVPVVLKGTADATATIAAAPDDNAKTSAENILYGTFATKTVAAGVAGLLQADGSFALNTSEETLPAHAAYIPGGIFDVETGIKVIDVNNEVSTTDNVYYDLSGRRINKPTKGLYLQKGKKVLVK